MRLITLFLLALTAARAQSADMATPQSLLVTRIYNIANNWRGECAAKVVDNRSTFLRRNNFHSLFASGSGTWSVTINYSDTACTGPWTAFGVPSSITQATSLPVIAAIGYHPYIQIVVTGNALATYSAAKDFWPVSIGGTGAAGPGVPVGGTVGQVLTKTSSVDFATAWQAAQGGSGVGTGGVTYHIGTGNPNGQITCANVGGETYLDQFALHVWWCTALDTYTDMTAGAAVWGAVGGNIALQTDLMNLLNGKSATGHTHPISDVVNLSSSLAAKMDSSARGALSGVAPLDGLGKVPLANLPASSGLTAIVQDTAPTLGGALNMNGFAIQTVTPAEMARVHGLTSPVQTQLDNKESIDTTILRQANLAGSGVALTASRSDHNHTGTYATLLSPTFTGVPTAPTAAANDNSTQVATTAYADRARGIPYTGATTDVDLGIHTITAAQFIAPLGTSFSASGAEQNAPTVTTPTLYFDLGDHVVKYLNSSSALASLMIVAKASRTANRFLTNIPGTGIQADALITNGDLPTAAMSGVLKYTAGVPSAIGTSSTNCVHEDGSSGACGGSAVLPTDSGNKVIATPADGSSGVTAARVLVTNDLPGSFFKLATGSANAYVVAPTNVVTAYVNGEKYFFESNFANTGAATAAFSGLSALPLKKWSAGSLVDVASGDIPSASHVSATYGSTCTCLQIYGGLNAPATIAPADAHYLTTQAEAGLSAESNLGALTTGLVKITVSGSVATPATATAGTDYPGLATANTFSAGAKQVKQASATTAGDNIGCAALPSTPATGDWACDSGDANKMKWWNGSAWQTAGASVTGLGDPGSNGIVNRTGSGTTAPATAGDLAAPLYAAGGGTANAQTATYSPAIAALVDGLRVCWKPTAANSTTTPTFSPNGLTAHTIVKAGGAVAANDIITTVIACAVYDTTGTQWELANPQTVPAGSGDFSSNTSTSVDSELVLFSGTAGKTGKRATQTGIAKVTAGVLDVSTAGDLSAPLYAAGAGSANAQTAAYTPAVTALANGLRLCWKPTAANSTTTPTFSPDSLTAHTIVKAGGALVANDILTTAIACAVYNTTGTQWELQNPQTASTAGTGDASTNTSTSVDSEIAIFSSTTGKLLKRATQTGVAKVTSGVLGVSTAADLASPLYAAGGGSANAQTATYSPANAALADGLRLCWKPTAANTTTTPTFAPDGLTAHTLVKAGGALVSNDLITTAIACAVYDSTGTQWELQNPQTAAAAGTDLNSATGDVSTAQIENNAVTSAKLAVVNTIGQCTFENDSQSATPLTAAQMSGSCVVPKAATIIEVDVFGSTQVITGTATSIALTGTGSIQIGKYTPNGGAATASLMSGLLATASGKACAKTSTAAACINGLTSSGTISITTTALSAGDILSVTAATADGVQTKYNVTVIYTIN